MNRRPMLVSLHLPKTAGTSFAETLRAASGAGYRADYGDLPMQHGPLRRRWDAIRGGRTLRHLLPEGPGCVHGHFLAMKYRIALAGRLAMFITWLREPTQRLASHYAFWRRDYDGSDPAQPLRNRMLREDWSFERFALGPEMRNVYRQYLWGVDPARFDFIGITEYYQADLRRLVSMLGCEPVEAAALVNPDSGGEAYDVEPALQARIERFHAADYALYRQALARRSAWSR